MQTVRPEPFVRFRAFLLPMKNEKIGCETHAERTAKGI